MDTSISNSQNNTVTITSTIPKADYIAQQQAAIDQNNQSIADLQSQIASIQAANETLQSNINAVN